MARGRFGKRENRLEGRYEKGIVRGRKMADTLTCLLLGDLGHPHMLNGRGITLQGLGDTHAAR